MEPRLQLIDVRKAYGDFLAVDGVSLAVPPGTIFGLLGPNGAGKTTTMRMIIDIIAPTPGEVRLFGRTRRPEDLDRIGYLPEERGLYRKMTAVEHLAFLGQLHGLGRKERSHEPGGGSSDWGSGTGQGPRSRSSRRACSRSSSSLGTVLHDPEMVILDEPFSGLDPINQGLFKDVLAEFKAEGRTILFSTHVMEQAEKLCDHICLLSRGRAILEGELGAIKRRLGGNSYRIVADGDPAAWTRVGEIPGVEAVVPGEGEARVLLAPEAEGPLVLRELTRFLAVREFRSREPDLEEIFIKAVGDAA
jgi:ABC-2 type transport system ATP-binding protein